MTRSLTFAFVLFSGPKVFAIINCLHENPARDLAAIHKVAVVEEDGEIGRRTEEEYASDHGLPLSVVQNRFAATGVLKCGRIEQTAQLTGSSNVLTTAAHAFIDRKTCKKVAVPESCTFTTKIGSTTRESKVSRLVKSGLECPHSREMYEDWAVLLIDPPINGVTPYKLPGYKEAEEEEKVKAVAVGSDDFVRTINGKLLYPKSIEDCRVKKNHKLGRTVLGESTCDISPGASGSAILGEVGGADTILGISVTQQTKATSSKNKNSGAYKANSWNSFHVPMNGEFLRTVEQASRSAPVDL